MNTLQGTRMIYLLDETIEKASDATQLLDDQGIQLNKISKKEESIHQNLEGSKDVLKSMNGYFYHSTKIFRPSFWKKNQREESNSVSSQKTHSYSDNIINRDNLLGNQYETGLEDDQNYLANDETDDLINELTPRLKALKELGLRMNDHLVKHNDLLDNLSEKIIKSNNNIRDLNRKIVKKL